MNLSQSNKGKKTQAHTWTRTHDLLVVNTLPHQLTSQKDGTKCFISACQISVKLPVNDGSRPKVNIFCINREIMHLCQVNEITEYYFRKSSILFAIIGVRKISSLPCGFSPIKILFFCLYYPKSLFSRINEVYVSLYSDILLKKHKLHL